MRRVLLVWWVMSVAGSRVMGVAGNRVLFLVLEGLTDDLLDRIATPALDAVASAGHRLKLKPEFPAETLPTLQAMLTGHHSEMTGVLGAEVNSDDRRLTETDMDFWMYNPNISNIAELNNVVGGRTGCVRVPGSQFYAAQDRILQWGTVYHIVDQITESSNVTQSSQKRYARSAAEDRTEAAILDHVVDQTTTNIQQKDIDADRHSTEVDRHSTEADSEDKGHPEDIDNQNKTEHSEKQNNKTGATFDRFFINKTSDKTWLDWAGQAETVAGWLADPVKPANLVLFKLDEPANQIRAFGPNSQEADLAVYKVDQFVGHLVGLLESRGVLESTNLVVTGLHGFAELSAENVVDLTKLVDAKDYSVYGLGPVVNLAPVQLEQELDIFAALIKGDSSKFVPYTRHGLPDRYKYKHNSRVSDIVLVAEEGVAFAHTFYTQVKQLNQRSKRMNLLSNKYGYAGYDNDLPSMQSFVLLKGPGVLKSQIAHQEKTEEINAVDVYPLLAHLIGITAGATNGSLEVVGKYLSNPPSPTVQVIKKAIDYIQQENVLPTAGILVVVTSVLLIVALVWCCMRCRKNKDIALNHSYKYSQVKGNRRPESRVDGSEEEEHDKIGLLTSAIMAEENDMDV